MSIYQTLKVKARRLFSSRPHVAVIRLEGTIGGGQNALSDARLAATIERAFKSEPSAVALAINCPGGSPVQSSLIAGRIRDLADRNNVPVFAFVEDVAASGGYWLATAADEIYADPASVLGSIGVISAGFGLQDALERYGVERRVHTAGESKSFHDPFREETAEDVARLKGILDQIHVVFKAHIRKRRPQLTNDDLFTGEFWLGEKAVELGLADGIDYIGPKMRAKFGDKVRFERFGKKRSWLSRLGASITGGAVRDALGVIEERASFGRFGL